MFLLYSFSCLAGGMAGENDIGEVRIGLGVVRVNAENDSWSDPDNCSGDQSEKIGSLYLSKNNTEYQEIYSAILAARMAKKTANFFVSGCETVNGKTYPLISTMYL